MTLVLVSACLLGRTCRYDGGACYHEKVAALCRRPGVACLPICPEILGGLPTPRPAAEISGGHGGDVWSGRARVRTARGEDVTPAFISGARRTFNLVRQAGVRAAILKERSPSCGKHYVYDGTFRGLLTPGPGVTAALLARQGLPLFNEEEVDALVRLLAGRD